MHIKIYLYTYVYICAYIYACLCIFMYIHVCKYLNIYIHMYKHMRKLLRCITETLQEPTQSHKPPHTCIYRPEYRPAQSLYIHLNIYLKSIYRIHIVCGIMLGCINKPTPTRLDQCIVLRSVYAYIYHIHRKSSLYLPSGSVNLVLKLMGIPDGIS